MKRYSFFARILSIALVSGLLLYGISMIVQAAPEARRQLAPAASLPNYSYSAALEVHNNITAILPAGYTVNFTLSSAALVSAGKLKADCSDLRLAFTNGAETELDRLVSGCNTTATQVQFRTQADIAASAIDTRYTLYYGNASAGAPPANPSNVLAFYEDFQDGNANGWNPAKGTWNVVNDADNYVYRYTGGGANWALSYATLPVSDIDYVARIRASSTTSWIGLAFRIQDQNNFVTFYESKDVSQFKLADIIADNHSIVTTPGFAMTPNLWYRLRLQAIGSQVRARIWQDGTSEPITWLIPNTADTHFLTSTNIGLTLYNHSTIADWDDIQVRRLVAAEPSVSLGETSWWDNAWGYRRQITLTNTSASTALPIRYTASFSFDTTALIGSGQLLSDCSDLRLVYDPGLAPAEIDRVVENCNTSQTTVWYALQRPVAASGQDKAYFLYYGNPAAGTPPANGMNVFIFFENWEQDAAHWTSAGGLDASNSGTMGASTISADASVSPTQSQKFNSFGAAGDAFSGYIPVSPSTSYAISVWGRSPNTNVCLPVGLDPYTSATPGAKGLETWLWTDEWRYGPQWAWHSASFTTTGTTTYIKIKSEVWGLCSNPGAPPAYIDNLALRYSIGSVPTLVIGDEESSLPGPTIADITNPASVNLGGTIQVSAAIATPNGTITSATLRILAPQVVDVPMALASGDATNGAWQASFTPTQGGLYTFRILAVASTGRNKLSEQHTFTASDITPPVITPVAIINPILVKNTQTLTVRVTDNGLVNSVSVTVGGTTYPMTANGDQYSFSWQITTTGTIPYTVNAVDSSNNVATLNASFVSQPREVDVCTWEGCRQGAASWSEDDGNNACYSNLTAAGIKGTFFYNGTSTPGWFADYSAAGHEIASHTVGHPCNTPTCSPTCTAQSLAALPVDPAAVQSYRVDQLEPNIAAIEAGTGKPVLSLAWPCGCTDPSRWQAASSYILGARGYYDYIAQLTWVEDVNLSDPVNFFNLNSAHTYSQALVDQAYTEGKWSITTSHGECTGIDYLGQQNSNGHLWVAPIGDVLKYIKVRDASQFSNYSRAGRTISFDVVHNLSPFTPASISTNPFTFLPITYDNPVTLKVHILASDTVLSVIVGSTSVDYSIQTIDGDRYVTFDAAVNAVRHVVVNLAAPAPTLSNVSAIDPVELGSAAKVSATVIPAEGTTLGNITLRVFSPESYDNPMVLASGDQYIGSFTPAQLGSYSYQVIASNNEGASSQSTPASFLVRDTTPPSYRSQSQSQNQIPVGGLNTLSAQVFDLGGLDRAVLSTNESGAWQDFDWPVSDWWNHNWTARQPVTFTESDGIARTNEIVDIPISSDTFTGLADCANQLRVADQNKSEIPSQVYGEQVDGNGSRSCHLVFQVTLAANASRTYYIYYGNPSATAPQYSSDLSVSGSTLRTIQNSYFNLDLDLSSGIITRVSLPQGSNTNLPLSPSSDYYWGWHQVCSSLDGNITGKNRQCIGGTADASGLTATDSISGPLVREITLTNVKSSAAYTITYRFFANAPYYQYSLARTGTAASIMNNFWYLNGSISHLGYGTGGTPTAYFNTYDNLVDHIRFSTLTAVDLVSIDGTDNDGTDLGGTNYMTPTAAGLSLYVATGADQTATQGVLAQLTSLPALSFSQVENIPAGQYGSPIALNSATEWTTTSYTWQNAAITNQSIGWRIKYCDISGNCAYTPVSIFQVSSGGTPPLPASFFGLLHFNKDAPGVGTTIEATIPGVSGSFNTSVALDGSDLVYMMDVPGDISGTPAKEGGVEGDTVSFSIGGRILATAPWHSGTHTQVDLNSFALDLLPGWNLVSFPLHPASTNPADVLSSIISRVDTVFAWNPDAVYPDSQWLMFAPGQGFGNTLSTLDEKMGFWIHITPGDAVTLYMTGSIPTSTSIPLSAAGGGWNLVGFPADSEKGLPAALLDHGVGTNLGLVFAYHASEGDPWKMFDRSAPAWVNDLSSLAPGWGYWVNVSADSNWIVNYP